MKRVYKVLIALAVVISFSACEKKITDLRPIDQIPADAAIQNMADVTNALNGVYATWQQRRSVYINSLMTDEVRLGTGTEYRNVGNILFNWQHVSDSQDWRDAETGGVWTNLYSVIDRANRLLELMEPVPTTTSAEAAQKAQFRGELLALRALAHFDLLRYFSETVTYTADRPGVVLQTEYVKAPGAYRPSRNTQGEVITQINADLAEAKGLIPATWTNISRITRNAVTTGQARVALHTGNWQEVVTASTEVINSQPLTPRSAYADLWTIRSLPENQSTEVIWKLNIAPSNLGLAVGSLFQDIGAGAVQASGNTELVSLYNADDIRLPTFFNTAGSRPLISKYGLVQNSNGENFQYDIKVMRTSELVLARAEANAELDQLVAANADLSLLRSNRIAGYVHVPILTKAALISAILEERRKELVYEGHRYHDLRRKNLPITRSLEDAGGNAASQSLAPTSTKFILPIPQQETFANPNVAQNPGY